MKKKNEAIIIRNRGGKLLEIKIIPQGKQGKTAFVTDNVVSGSMETREIPDNFSALLAWLDQAGKLPELEKMIAAIFR